MRGRYYLENLVRLGTLAVETWDPWPRSGFTPDTLIRGQTQRGASRQWIFSRVTG